MPHLEFHFDVVCPFAYLGAACVEKLCGDVEATLSWHPFLLGGVLQANGTDPNFTLKLPAAKLRHNLVDAVRWADCLGVPFSWHTRHPLRTLTAMRALVLLADEDNRIADPSPIHALYRAYWVEGRDVDRPDVVADVLSEVGLDGPTLVDRTRDPRVKQRLRDVSTAIAGRGVFGAPAMFVGDELFWGQDRLVLVEAALREAA